MKIAIEVILIVFLISMAVAGLSFAPWVPAFKRDLKRIFKLADLQPGQVFYDLGCGNGRTVVYAAKNFNVKAVGIEIAIPLYLICKLRQLFLRDINLVFKYGNFFKKNISEADVVYFFGMPKHLGDKLKNKLIKELKPGTKVISYTFPIIGWEPLEVNKPLSTDIAIYLYKIS